ncbi:phage head-tail connector protein, partial [Clostridium sp. HCS.1]
MTQLERLKIRLEINKEDTSQDDLLNMFLEDAESEILDFTNRYT